VKWTKKHLLGLKDLDRNELNMILDTAEGLKEVSTRSIKKVPALQGRTVALLFFEPSTRTSMSFQLAAQRLSADLIQFNKSGSSLSKGETLIDTASNIEAMGVDMVVVRHSCPGVPQILAKHLNCAIVNAGDGCHEHPTQGLLDIFTIREKLGTLEGVKVAIVGDIRHSRVARSNIFGLLKLGAKVTVVGPPTLIPKSIAKMGVEISYNLDETIKKVDVVNCLRIQMERQGRSNFPSLREYALLFGMNRDRLKKASKNLVVMHPGPINRGVEMTAEVADSKNSVILQQVSNGLACRMAVFYLLNGSRIDV